MLPVAGLLQFKTKPQSETSPLNSLVRFNCYHTILNLTNWLFFFQSTNSFVHYTVHSRYNVISYIALIEY